MEEQQWSSFPELPQFLIENLQNNDYNAPFPVQVAVLEKFFASDVDLAIGFPTGSGKTLAYLIPIISCLYKRIVQRLRAIIVVPNRELAIQVYNVVCALIQNSKLTCAILSSNYWCGESSSYTNVPDIYICSSLSLSSYLLDVDDKLLSDIEYIVLDEGDVILEQPLENWLDHVQRSLNSDPIPEKFTIPLVTAPPKDRRIRKILCSATLSRNSKQSEDFKMQFPEILISSDKSRYVIPNHLKEEFIIAERQNKPAILQSLTTRFQFILCFVSTTKRAVALANIMRTLLAKTDFQVIEFAASLKSDKKNQAFESVDQNSSRLIICTDSLARGINLPYIDAVINFDAPASARTYIHRIGRTARGGNSGTCVTFLLDSELILFRDIISKIDGANPQKTEPKMVGLTGKFYRETVKGFDSLKPRKLPQKKMAKYQEMEEEEMNEIEEEEKNENGEEERNEGESNNDTEGDYNQNEEE
ncbi:DEAD/DEAH box helicase family protein [Trichomonas vaginalis G3]|uniref:ATP-dependent RNA helicase n=1 Tax=Trichomonas vaginalis (strain ATCC PRA-98 / G3) TaxID=412133 RepID=A2DTU8_TRIV3|nr:helicase protein [Trichomonas vaginalis G3]EAY16245.1 DEAD/DEAH box helicase family protein [Trichomonas vaginalis G3]KAI5493250.1 helicase protein [Trichomonas vaginalis G3]|eukprot:XP_001328468.1 DEAD/DEAH box helicase family protein [Trichomonas vaginalis G3]